MHVGQMKRIMNASQNFTLLMFKHRDAVNQAFQGDASNEQFDFIEVANDCNKFFQGSNMLPPKRGKQDEEKLQQHTSLLNSDVNKIPMLKSAKVKEKVPKEFEKEGIGCTSSSWGFQNGAWKWQKHLVKSRAKYKARQAKHCHVDNVRGEKNFKLFKFPLIDE